MLFNDNNIIINNLKHITGHFYNWRKHMLTRIFSDNRDSLKDTIYYNFSSGLASTFASALSMI